MYIYIHMYFTKGFAEGLAKGFTQGFTESFIRIDLHERLCEELGAAATGQPLALDER